MNSKHICILFGLLGVVGCSSVQKTEFDPNYLASIKDNKPLEVPHRDWISEGCYPKRELRGNKWVEVKVCDKK